MDDAAQQQSRAAEDAEASAADRYFAVRRQSEKLCAPLATEDYVVQPMADASPAKWHLAHTSWFFETFLLKPLLPDYSDLHPAYAFLFNSYYVQAGARHERTQRGLITRPTVEETYAYRRHVDSEMLRLLSTQDGNRGSNLHTLLELGLNHEQQHQELIVTDIKYTLSMNPLHPAYHDQPDPPATAAGQINWHKLPGGETEIGYHGKGFCFDNEGPRHHALLRPYALASRCITNGEYLQFMADGGYQRAELWLSDGFAAKEQQGWDAPLYWLLAEGAWHNFTLSGLQPLQPDAPLCHVSFYEAEAFARWAGYGSGRAEWAGARLPTEYEWEAGAAGRAISGNFAESGLLCPRANGAAAEEGRLQDLFGNLWEWTQSPYSPYPGYHPQPGALGEYNGKFMANQFVLRGGSCATPEGHIRASYRNFFHPDKRWQFSGIRLARDI